MIFSLILPFLIGSFGVLQNTLNRKFADNLGVPFALVVNNCVLLACGLALFFALRLFPADALPDLFREKEGWRALGARHVLPGLLGFFIICTAPWAIAKVGATRVFVVIIAAQIVVSIIWDWKVEAMAVSGWRVLGGALAMLGAVLATF